jgi:PRTRC genetic system protein E
MQILADRTVMITAARLNDDAIRVNVIPQRTCETENAALATPFSITGTPAELDAELSIHLLGYVESHRQLRTSLAEAKSQMDAAAKAAQEEAKRKTAERKKKPEEKGTGEEKATTEPTVETSPDAKSEPTRVSSEVKKHFRSADHTSETQESVGCRVK